MSEGIWTIRPCPHRQASDLAKELGLSEITASVLVRRGYGDPAEARAYLAGEQPLHDPRLLGAMDEAVEAINAAITAGKRIGVPGANHVDGTRATAPRRGPGCRPPPPGGCSGGSWDPTWSGICRAASTRATASVGRRSSD